MAELHVYLDDEGVEVWLDSDDGHGRDGVCLALGDTTQEALAEAQVELEQAMALVEALRSSAAVTKH